MNQFRSALWVGASEPARDAIAGAGYALVGRARGVAEGLERIRALEPALALVDSVLPGGDGAAFAARVAKTPLNRRPDLLVMRVPGMRAPGIAGLEARGAALIDKPPTADMILEAVEALSRGRDRLPAGKSERLEALMDALGIPAHPGRACLAAAVALVWRDRGALSALNAALYPKAGRARGMTGPQTERAIRHVIETAWRTGDMAAQQRIFGDTIDARRGRPTCGEMIAQLADILRWEG